jgi:hypothetical protein
MRWNHASILLGFMLLLGGSLGAQEKAEKEIDIHQNVKLIQMAVPKDIPDELRNKYQKFLPLFVEALKEHTTERSSENALTVRIVPGVKEIGSAKIKRVFAKVTAYRKHAKNEYVGSLLLHNYAKGELINKEEIGQFLTKQILNPLGTR